MLHPIFPLFAFVLHEFFLESIPIPNWICLHSLVLHLIAYATMFLGYLELSMKKFSILQYLQNLFSKNFLKFIFLIYWLAYFRKIGINEHARSWQFSEAWHWRQGYFFAMLFCNFYVIFKGNFWHVTKSYMDRS